MKSQFYAFGLIVCALGTAQAAPAVVAKTAEPLAEIAPLSAQNGLKVSISATSQSGNQMPTIALHHGDPHINVVLQNTSSKPIQIFQEWNSWGYYNLILEISAIDSKTMGVPLRIGRGAGVWFANVPSSDIIGPGEAIVREARLWVPPETLTPTTKPTNVFGPFFANFPLPTSTTPRQITMRAVFSNSNDRSGSGSSGYKGVVWTGRIASAFQTYIVRWGDAAKSSAELSPPPVKRDDALPLWPSRR